jgi:putative flavoprotein involved in K+ transport
MLGEATKEGSMSTITYAVPDISTGHCAAAISAEVGALPGVDTVGVDLGAGRVTVTGGELDDTAIRAAIDAAGYAVAGSSEAPRRRVEVAVVGAGQAGLAVGRFLALQGRDFVILDAGAAIGSAWRERWDSLVLFTPRRYSALPDLAFPGDPDGYPTRDEVVRYLEQYVSTFDLPVELDSRVLALTRADDGFVLELEDGAVVADQVVVATGPFQQPRTAAFADELAAAVLQLHSAAYRRPSDVPAGRVVVVGGGNTGYQIAQELSATHDVTLAIGSGQTPLPQRLLGRDLFWWLTRLGLLGKTADSRLGRRLRRRDTLIGSRRRALARRGVKIRPRAVGAAGRTLRFADGTEQETDAVIWATGYRSDYSWIRLPAAFDSDGHPRHRRGVTDVGGLYFVGLAWQHTRGSALLGWVGDDAEFIADELAAVRHASGGHTSTDYDRARTRADEGV